MKLRVLFSGLSQLIWSSNYSSPGELYAFFLFLCNFKFIPSLQCFLLKTQINDSNYGKMSNKQICTLLYLSWIKSRLAG